MSLLDAREILRKAKAEYRRALRVVDSHLRAAVAQDPNRIAEAREIQQDYAAGFTSVALGELRQPDPPPLGEDGGPVYPPEGPAAGQPPEDVPVPGAVLTEPAEAEG